jgi:hypothetical protein
MRLYPSAPRLRRRVILGDVATLISIAVFAWLGLTVYDNVAELASLGRGVRDAGGAVGDTGRDVATSLRGGLDSAADAIGQVPLIGPEVGAEIRAAGDSAADQLERRSGEARGRLVEAGDEGERRALQTARTMGWLAFLLPTAILLARVLPGRVREVRTRAAAERAFATAPPEILARRAAYSLPYETLLRHTPDPFGDLAAGRHEHLVAALAEHAHLAPLTGSPAARPAGGIENRTS